MKKLQHFFQYMVYRVDDNGNEFEMESFPSHEEAQAFALEYERRGHKQIYLIKRVTSSNSSPSSKND